MSEITINRRQTKEKSHHPKLGAAALGAAVLVALGVHTVKENTPPEAPALNAPYKEYVVKPGDTVSGILSEAYPDQDWRKITSLVEDQLPPEDQANHIVRPGQVLTLNTDAQIGEPVDNSTESNSAAIG